MATTRRLAELDATGKLKAAQVPDDVTTSAELTAAVQAAVDALVAGAPGALDTLNELAAALGDDAAFATTVTTALAAKADTASLGTAAAEDVEAFDPAGSAATAEAAANAYTDTEIGGLSGAFVGQYATASRPAAAAHSGKILWDTDEEAFFSSNGTVWAEVSLGGGTMAPSVVGHYFSASTVAWPAADRAIIVRGGGNDFVIGGRSYRYGLFRVSNSAGNIQFCVLKLSGVNFADYEVVMDSGVIACPAIGDVRLDLGETALPAGDYALALWASSTLFSTYYSVGSAGQALLRTSAAVSSLTTGIPSSGTGLSWGGSNAVVTFGLEAVPLA